MSSKAEAAIPSPRFVEETITQASQRAQHRLSAAWKEFQVRTLFIGFGKPKRITGRESADADKSVSLQNPETGEKQLIRGWPNEVEASFYEGKGVRVELLKAVGEWANATGVLAGTNVPPNWRIPNRLAHQQLLELGGGWKNYRKFKEKDRSTILFNIMMARGIPPVDKLPEKLKSALRILGWEEEVLKRTFDDRSGPDYSSVRNLSEVIRGKLPHISENLGRLWKKFLSALPEGTIAYDMQIRQFDTESEFDIRNPQHISRLLFATCQAYLELAVDASKYDQPIGYVKRSKTHFSSVSQTKSPFVMLYRSSTKKGSVLSMTGNDSYENFYSRIVKTLAEQNNWKDIKKHYEALVAIDLDRLTPYSPRANLGLHVARDRHPAISYYLATDQAGKLRLMSKFNHLPFDGMLAKLFIKGGQAGFGAEKKIYKGVNGFYEELAGRSLLQLQAEFRSEITYENYPGVNIAKIPPIDGRVSADTVTAGILWFWQIMQDHMQSIGAKNWDYLNPYASGCNFTVTDKDDARKSLAAASCWVANPGLLKGTSLNKINQATSILTALCGFKADKDRARYQVGEQTDHIPAGMLLMSLVNNAKVAEVFRKGIYRFNRNPLVLGPMVHIFPKTVITEFDDELPLLHSTVCGSIGACDTVCNISREGIALVYSMDTGSQILKPDQLRRYVEWIAPGMKKYLEILHDWMQNNEKDVLVLNQKLQELADLKRVELKIIFPGKIK